MPPCPCVLVPVPRLAAGARRLLAAVAAACLLASPAVRALDLTPPPAPVLETPAPGQVLDAAAAPGGLVTVLGGVEEGAAVELVLDGQPARATAAGGLFALVRALPDGQHRLEVAAVDAAGNRSAATALTFSLDTVAPVAPRLTWPGPDDRAPAGALALAGTAEPGCSVLVAVGAVEAWATAAEDGTWTAEVTLAEGTWSATLSAVDVAGNRSAARQASLGVVPPQDLEGGGCGLAGGATSALALLGLLAAWPRRRAPGAA